VLLLGSVRDAAAFSAHPFHLAQEIREEKRDQSLMD
jgi:hypothetical protein